MSWNNYVAHGREASLVLSHASALLPQHVDELATAIGDRGDATMVFAWQVYQGSVEYMHGFRESPEKLLHPSRLWPWFVPLERMFEPNPVWGVGTETLRALQQRCGVRRYHSRTGSRAHRGFASSCLTSTGPTRLLGRERLSIANGRWRNKIDYEVPALRIGTPLRVRAR